MAIEDQTPLAEREEPDGLPLPTEVPARGEDLQGGEGGRDAAGIERLVGAVLGHGRRVRESTGSPEKHEAVRFLRAREGRVAAGQPVQPRVERIRYEEVAEDLRRDYQTTGRRDLAEAEHRLRHLDGFFRGRLIADLSGADVTAYAAARQGEGAANGTINREGASCGGCSGSPTSTASSCGSRSSAV